MLSVLSIVGTRPEAIKMAPVIRELHGRASEVRSIVCSTGQHRELLDQVCELFGIVPDIELGVMQPNQSLSDLTARLLHCLDATVREVKPNWILAQGGIQEEAPGLGIPVLVTREKTERPEGVDAGEVKLIGTCGDRIRAEILTLLENPEAHSAMARGVNPYGDGNAARRIVSALFDA